MLNPRLGNLVSQQTSADKMKRAQQILSWLLFQSPHGLVNLGLIALEFLLAAIMAETTAFHMDMNLYSFICLILILKVMLRLGLAV